MTTHSLIRILIVSLVLFMVSGAMCSAQGVVELGEIEPRKKIGLVLSGGGARGAAHVGVIKVLDELRIPIDYIAGTSMGAIVGGLYASGLNAQELADVIENADWNRLLSDKPPRSVRTFRRKSDDQEGFLVNFEMGLRGRHLVFPKGLLQGQVLTLELRHLLSEAATINQFDDLPIPFRAIAADIVSGEEVVMGSGDLVRSIRASMSVPGLFKPVRLDDHLLVDGGIVNNLPIDIVKQMGAEILIVVDVGTPPADEEELSSPLQITSQMLTILIASQSQRQKKLMAVDDVLITPELGSFSASAFSQSIKAIDIGESSARKSLAKLAAYSLSQQAYVDHRNLVQAKRQGQPFIEKIVVENQSRLSSKVLDTRLSNHAGKVLDTLRLESEITNIYGFDTYETVDYQLTTKEGINELHIRAKNKEWGPNYIRFGVNLEDDFRGDSSYNLAARFTRTEVNRLGGEIRADAIIGDTPALSLELYQPLDYASRWFVNPKLAYENASSGVFQNNKQIALFRSEQSTASLAVGRNFGNWGELRLAVRRNFSNNDIEIGELEQTTDTSEFSNFELSFQYDTIDRVAVPRSGALIALNWLGLRDDFGADQSIDALSLSILKPQTWGRNTLLHWWNVGSLVNEGEEPVEPFRLGGLFSLSGLAPDELRGQHIAIGRTLFYRRLVKEVSSLVEMPLYLGASLEIGNVWQDKDDISSNDLRYSASAFLVLDSVIGPLYLAYGRNDNGLGSGYLFLGQTF